MKSNSKTVFLFLLTVVFYFMMMVTESASECHTGDSYLEQRNSLLEQEKLLRIGGNLTLVSKEVMVNQVLLAEKVKELNVGYENSSAFLASLNFFEAKALIEESEVFKIIRKIPKGASLHTHLLAAVSVDFIIKNFTYRDNLYAGYINDIFKLKFLSSVDQGEQTTWTDVKKLRESQTEIGFNDFLKQQLSLIVSNADEVYDSAESVWKKFKKIFSTVYDFLSYKPVFEEYLYQLLQELYEDNVMYTEIKGTIMPLYEIDGKKYSTREFFEIFNSVVEHFKRNNPNFQGARYIHSVYRGITLENLRTNLEEITDLKNLFPDLIVGIDFVGFEEDGNCLLHYHEELLKIKSLNFFFHAGESNWYGHTDNNLIDAVLLSSSRIGHGFALPKHPVLMKMVKEQNIALEISPISNQVLMLNKDPRNHPASAFVALGYPIVICNDDPSAWGASGLSYDWYVTFMAMTSKNCGLEFLKQISLNSIIHSALPVKEKERFKAKFEEQWESFLDNFLAN